MEKLHHTVASEEINRLKLLIFLSGRITIDKTTDYNFLTIQQNMVYIIYK